MIAAQQRLQRRHLRLRKGRPPVVLQLDPDGARIDVACAAPGPRARVPGPHLLGHQREDRARPRRSASGRDLRRRIAQPLQRRLGAIPSRCSGARSARPHAAPPLSAVGRGRWTISTGLSRRAPRGTGSGPSCRRSRPRRGPRPAGRPPGPPRSRNARCASSAEPIARAGGANRASARKPDRR